MGAQESWKETEKEQGRVGRTPGRQWFPDRWARSQGAKAARCTLQPDSRLSCAVSGVGPKVHASTL